MVANFRNMLRDVFKPRLLQILKLHQHVVIPQSFVQHMLLRFHRMLLSHQALTKAQIALDLLHLISNLLSQVLTFGLDLLVEQQMAHLQPQICPPTTFRVTDTLVSHSFSNPVFHTISENPACLYHSKAILIP